MCGIFGVISASGDHDLVRSLAVSLLEFSATRGREAAGVAVHDGTRIDVLKQGGSVQELIANPKFKELLARPALAITGHSRLATNGAQSNVENSQPVITRGAVTLHNGIVVNDRVLEARYPAIVRQGELDSEVLAALLRTRLDEHQDLATAARETFAEIQGSASISMMFDDLDVMLLATNTGSLFQLSTDKVIAFASERFILKRVLDDKALHTRLGDCRIGKIGPGP